METRALDKALPVVVRLLHELNATDGKLDPLHVIEKAARNTSISGLGEVAARGSKGGVSVAVKIQLQTQEKELRQLRQQVATVEAKVAEERQAKRAAETKQKASEAAVEGLMRGAVEENHLTRAGEKVAKCITAVVEASMSKTTAVRLENAAKEALEAGEKTVVALKATREEAAAAIADAKDAQTNKNAYAARARKAERSLGCILAEQNIERQTFCEQCQGQSCDCN